MKKGFSWMLIMCLVVSCAISFPVFGRSAWAGERSTLTRGNAPLTLSTVPLLYTKFDYSMPLPESFQGLVDQFMNLAFMQNLMDLREQSKLRRAERLENWKSIFNL